MKINDKMFDFKSWAVSIKIQYILKVVKYLNTKYESIGKYTT